MKNFFALTAGLCLITSSAFAAKTAEQSFYCSNQDQTLQFTQDQALVTVDEQTLAYRVVGTNNNTWEYSRGLNAVTLSFQSSETLESKTNYVGLCVNGVQKVQTQAKSLRSVSVTIEDMETQSAILECEATTNYLEYCN